MKRLALFACLVLLGSCSKNTDSAWLGYAVGDNAFVAAPQAGWVARLAVQRGDAVRVGQLLFTLDDTSQVSARDQAEAAIALAQGQMTEAKANLDLTQRELVRQSGLLRDSAGTKQAYDIAKSNYDQAVAQVAQIRRAEEQARAALVNAALPAHRTGRHRTHNRPHEDVYFRTGEYAPAMTPVISLLPPQNVYVRFFVPETEFAHVQLGQQACRIGCDGCAADMTATVTSLRRRRNSPRP